MDEREAISQSAGMFGRLVEQINPEQWGAPTPDADWKVKDLVQHVAYEHFWVGGLLAGKTMAEVGDKYNGDILGSKPKEVWGLAAESSQNAAKNLADLDQTVDLSYGPTLAKIYLRHMTLDTVIHAWDLAKSIGANPTLDSRLVEQAYAWLLPEAENWRQNGALGDAVEVPSDAPVLDKLLGLSGRDPFR